MFWKILWLLFALAVVGYAIWSLLALLQQKRAWKAFADKYKMQYLEEGFFSPPGFWGILQNKKVVVYVDIVQKRDKQKAGSWNVIDVFFQSPFDDKVLAMGASTLFSETVGDTSGLDQFIPNDLGWGDKTPLYTNDAQFFRSYLNRENVQSLLRLKKMKNGGFNFILQPESGIVSYYTKQPLDSPKKINAIVKVLLDVAGSWEKGTAKAAIRPQDTHNLTFEEEDEAERKGQDSADSVPPSDKAEEENASTQSESMNDTEQETEVKPPHDKA